MKQLKTNYSANTFPHILTWIEGPQTSTSEIDPKDNLCVETDVELENAKVLHDSLKNQKCTSVIVFPNICFAPPAGRFDVH